MDPHDPDASTDGPSPTEPTGPAWTPPDAGSGHVRSGGRSRLDVEVEGADGPPVPPPMRRRRRRRQALLAGAVVVLVGVPVGIAMTTVFDTDDAPAAIDGDAPGGDGEQGTDAGGGAEGDRGADGDNGDNGDALDAPDLDELAGSDAVYGQLLVDIDASERVMMNFQDEVAAVFSTPTDTPEHLLEELQGIGETGRDDLLAVRDRLDDELDVEGAEQVRDRYVEHLDSWADYMDAVSEDPSVLGGEGAGAGFTVVINATADAFARALEDELPEDADASVRAYADDILDRGFRGSGDSQV